MEFNLRKARKLESSIQNYLFENTFEVKANIRSMGSLDEAKQTIELKRDEFHNLIKEREQLLRLKYSIRRNIEILNEKSGINELINEKVLIEMLIKDIDSINKNDSYTEIELSDLLKLHASRNENKNSINEYMSKTTKFPNPVLEKKDLEELLEKKLEMKKQIEKIEDNLSCLNLSTKFTLLESEVKLLKSNKLL